MDVSWTEVSVPVDVDLKCEDLNLDLKCEDFGLGLQKGEDLNLDLKCDDLNLARSEGRRPLGAALHLSHEPVNSHSDFVTKTAL